MKESTSVLDPVPPAPRPRDGVLDAMGEGMSRALSAVREQGFERFVGERLFAYVGMLLVVLGGAFFLKYAAMHSGPWGRVAGGLLAGAVAAAGGEALRRRPRVKPLSVPVTAGGWALLLYTAYAAHAVPASRVVEDPRLALALLVAAAAGMIAHSLAARSRLLTGYAFATAYFAFAATDFGPQTLGVTTVLALAGAWLARRERRAELVPIGLVGFAVNYWPTLERVCAGGSSVEGTGLSLGAACAVYAATAVAVEGGGFEEREAQWTDAAQAFGAVLLAAAVHAQAWRLPGSGAAAAGLAAAATLALIGGRGAGQAASVQGFLSAALAALACWRFRSPDAQLWGFALCSALLGLSSRATGRAASERYGIALGLLGGLTWLDAGAFGRPLLAASAMGALGASSYLLALTGGGAEARGRSRWRLHGGLAALGAAATTLSVDPRLRLPACAAASLALLVAGRSDAELAADLRLQAYALASFAPVLGSFYYLEFGATPRALTPLDAAVYGGTALAMLAPLALGPRPRGGTDAEETLARHLFAALSLLMLSLFVGHEASGVHVTLWWTALGGGYLLAGLWGESRELRWPALALLGLCTAKALFMDLTRLPMPYRMLSMSALGLLLVACSLAYVRWAKEEPEVLRLDDGDGRGLRRAS